MIPIIVNSIGFGNSPDFANGILTELIRTRHVLDRGQFDPQTEDYLIIAPIAGGKDAAAPGEVRSVGVPSKPGGRCSARGHTPDGYQARATLVGQRTFILNSVACLPHSGECRGASAGDRGGATDDGRRLHLIWDLPDTRRSAPWKSDYLCINPTFPILAVEFAGHVFLYLDDSEARIVQVAVPQPEDGPLANVFGAE